jgi:hypothetical protein
MILATLAIMDKKHAISTGEPWSLMVGSLLGIAKNATFAFNRIEAYVKLCQWFSGKRGRKKYIDGMSHPFLVEFVE